jgi:pyruvate dehydrogenase (quinone)
MKAAGLLETGVELKNPDFAAMANAMGIHGRRVTRASDLSSAVAEVLSHEGPALLDVVSNRLELSMPPKIRGEQVKGFSLYALKAVMSGRGDSILDLALSNLSR